jgi:TPR repeat protein
MVKYILIILLFFKVTWAENMKIEEGVKLFERKKFQDSFDILMPFARAGDAKAQFYIGLIYDMGSIKFMDKAKAVQWYLKSAKQGFARAEYDMGVMLSKGEGVAKNLKEAKKWYLKSAKHGNPHAMYNLGVVYQKGYGVTKDMNESMRWYELAFDRNISKAGLNLGIFYFKKDDYKKAFNYFLGASKLGNPKAMFYLAWLYQNGKGTPKSLENAKYWYRFSAVRGYKKSILYYQQILKDEKNYKEVKFWKDVAKSD